MTVLSYTPLSRLPLIPSVRASLTLTLTLILTRTRTRTRTLTLTLTLTTSFVPRRWRPVNGFRTTNWYGTNPNPNPNPDPDPDQVGRMGVAVAKAVRSCAAAVGAIVDLEVSRVAAWDK